ncbi:MAG: hypothetical protein ACUVSF_10790 [Anaerolineae bacterium]
MKWAQTLISAPCLLERDIAGYKINDIDSILDLLNNLHSWLYLLFLLERIQLGLYIAVGERQNAMGTPSPHKSSMGKTAYRYLDFCWKDEKRQITL